MEVGVPEISTDVIGLDPVSGHETVLAVCSCDVYSLENLEDSIRHVAESARRELGDGAIAWRPRLTARVWSEEGLRPCLNLSADTIRQMACVSASLDFAQRLQDGRDQSVHESNDHALEVEGQSPELVVLFVGDSPGTGKESVIAKMICQYYSLEGLQACVAQSIEIAQLKLQGATGLWHPQVGIRLSSDRSVLPALHLSAETVQQMASCEASLDFDPYV